MNDQRIAIITDSGTDTPADFVAAHDVRVIPLRINYSDGSSYENGVGITTEDVVRRFDEEIPSTSLPSPMKIQQTFEQAKRDGYTGAVVVTISSGLSATHETVSMVARQMEDFPVVVVDTKSIGIAAGFVVMEAVRQVEAGTPLERLNIKPVLTCDEREGKYVIEKKPRGWQKALNTQIELIAEQAARWNQVRVAVCTFDPSLREELAARVRERVTNTVEFITCGISADLLVHTGPTLVGMGVMGV